MEDHKLLSEMGTAGNYWATEFCKRFPAVDFGTALTWFCNAIEAGYDKGLKDAKARALELEGWGIVTATRLSAAFLQEELRTMLSIEETRILRSIEDYQRRTFVRQKKILNALKWLVGEKLNDGLYVNGDATMEEHQEEIDEREKKVAVIIDYILETGNRY